MGGTEARGRIVESSQQLLGARQISRRDALRGAGAGLALAGLGGFLAACSGGEPRSTVSPGPTSRRTTPGAEISSTSPTPTETETPNSLMIMVENGEFRRNGKRIGFVGENCYPLISNNENACPVLTEEGRTQWINAVASLGMNIIRFWDFAPLNGGGKDTTEMDAVLQQTAPKGIYLYPTLDNTLADCTGGGPKDDTWFVSGYKEAHGDQDSYLHYVQQMAEKYKGDPRIFAFQLMNEAQCSDPEVLREFTKTMVKAIKDIDPTRLVTLGVLGSGQPGAIAEDFGLLMDLCDFVDIHEYPNSEDTNYPPYQGLPGDRWNGIANRMQTAEYLNKPVLISEFGRLQTILTPQQRADEDRVIIEKLRNKYRRTFAGVIGWNLVTQGSQNQDDYSYTQDSPTAQMLKQVAPEIINPN